MSVRTARLSLDILKRDPRRLSVDLCTGTVKLTSLDILVRDPRRLSDVLCSGVVLIEFAPTGRESSDRVGEETGMVVYKATTGGPRTCGSATASCMFEAIDKFCFKGSIDVESVLGKKAVEGAEAPLPSRNMGNI